MYLQFSLGKLSNALPKCANVGLPYGKSRLHNACNGGQLKAGPIACTGYWANSPVDSTNVMMQIV
jgi:hypothetical protein